MALANPVVYPDNIHLDLGGSNCAWPDPGGLVTVTVFLGDLSEYSQNGITSISFRFERTFGGVLVNTEDLLGGPGDGNVEADGWVSTSVEGCEHPNAWGAIPLAQFVYWFNGEPGTIEVQPHLENGPTYLPCDSAEIQFWNYEEMYYCSYAGVWMEPPEGCGPVTPVTEFSWTAIKALYR